MVIILVNNLRECTWMIELPHLADLATLIEELTMSCEKAGEKLQDTEARSTFLCEVFVTNNSAHSNHSVIPVFVGEYRHGFA